MADMATRDDLLRLVHRRLTNRDFAERCTVVGKDGSRPIVVALREDTIRHLGDEVLAMGGAANVVAPLFDGLIVFALYAEAEEVEGDLKVDDSTLDAKCTVGLLIQRMMSDAGQGEYRFFKSGGPGNVEHGRAESAKILS